MDTPTTLKNGICGEVLRIPTANPTGFHQAISETEAMPSAQIFGNLFLPQGDGPWPTVIVVPGSLGVAPSHVAKAVHLTDAQIAACVIDPFGARGVTSTVANQAQYSFAASAWDVLATADLLAAHSDIDELRIGAQGHSRGGSAILSAACMAQLVKGDGAQPLVGLYAAYPWSGQQFKRPEVGRAIVRSVIGDRDEWCLPQQVQGHMQAIRLCGGEASCRIFAGAHHSFDRDTPIERVADASVAPDAPTTYIAEDGALIDPWTGQADPALSERDLMLRSFRAGYGRRGARIGSADDQAKLFHEDMMRFWTAVMSGPQTP
ncbi:MAG: hypothetical protein OXF68_15325 [Gammaproteobacteria bacterium]|nr:hypothetical protein [Gammaproteobacteria bacterium]